MKRGNGSTNTSQNGKVRTLLILKTTKLNKASKKPTAFSEKVYLYLKRNNLDLSLSAICQTTTKNTAKTKKLN